MAFFTAMRQSEIMKLTWDRVDFAKGIITVVGQDTKNSLTKNPNTSDACGYPTRNE